MNKQVSKERVMCRVCDPTYGEDTFLARACMLGRFEGTKEVDVTIQVKEELNEQFQLKQTIVSAAHGRHRKTVKSFNGNPEKMKAEAVNELIMVLEDNARVQFAWCKELGMFEEYESWDDYKCGNE